MVQLLKLSKQGLFAEKEEIQKCVKIHEGIDIIHFRNVQSRIAAQDKFDRIVIDPPKRRNVMTKIYSPQYIESLVGLVRNGGTVVCYVPTKNLSPKLEESLKTAIHKFRETGQFEFEGSHKSTDILKFRKRGKDKSKNFDPQND